MILSLVLSSALAQSPVLKPELQVRPRFEIHTGRDGVEGGETGFFTQRSRLGASLTVDAVTVRAVGQDVRMWGEEANTLTDFSADGFDMHIATAAVELTDGATLTLGRQEVAVHEHRLIGTVGWAQQARSFDGGLFSADGEGWGVDAGAFVLTARTPRAVDHDAAMGFVRGGWKPEGGQLDGLYVLMADGNVSPMFHTAGLYAKGKTGPVSGRIEGYGQFGENRSAWMAGVSGTIAPDIDSKPAATLWYDHLSGDSTPNDGQIQAFNTLFATNHKFYGLMDVMWFAVGATADGQGLQDAALKLSMSPVEKVTAKLDAHLFLAPNPIGDAMLGQEMDFTIGIKATEGLTVGIGDAVLLRPDLALDSWSFVQVDAKL